jgi:CRP/FNR family transcriptional regulator, cyclic AMP receptor protein
MNSSMVNSRQPPSEYQENLEFLVQRPLFARLPLEPLKLMAYLCKRETFRPEEIIFREHQADNNAYLIIEGKVELLTEEGGELQYAEFGEGEVIGSISLFCDIERLFTLRAKTRVVCLGLSRDKFQTVLERFPGVGMKILESLLMGIYAWEKGLLKENVHACDQCLKRIGVGLF